MHLSFLRWKSEVLKELAAAVDSSLGAACLDDATGMPVLVRLKKARRLT